METQHHTNSFIRLLKNWTLPVAMVTGTVVYLVFAYTPQLAPAADFFGPIFETIYPVFMFSILFVTFCKVDFHRLRPTRWHLRVAIFQLLAVFGVVGLILYFHPSGDALVLAETLLCCIISPCAAAAAVVTAKLGGDLEQMTTYTFLSNFITALLIPVSFPLIDKAADITFLVAFLKILHEVCIVLLVPMLCAYVVKHFMKRFHRWIVSIKDLSYYLWGLSLSIVTGTTVKYICQSHAAVSFLLVIAFGALLICIVQYAVGRFIGHYSGHVIEAGQALGQKNTAFAVWVAYSYLNPLATVGPGCYIWWQNVINSIEIWAYRKRGLEQSA